MRSRFLFIIFLIGTITACKSYQKVVEKEVILSFKSFYDIEELSLKVNDSIVFTNQKLDKYEYTSIKIKANKIKLKGTFITDGVVHIHPIIKRYRKLELDTILYAKNGQHILIDTDVNNIVIKQNELHTLINTN